MSKSIVTWLKHDMNARRDPKILCLIENYGYEGLGRYWALIEFLGEQGGRIIYEDMYLNAIKNELMFKKLDLTKTFIEELIKIGLLCRLEDGFISSQRLLKDLKEKDDISNKKREAIKKRWGNNHIETDTDVLHVNKNSNTAEIGEEKKREEKKREEKYIYDKVLEFAKALKIETSIANDFYLHFKAQNWKTSTGTKITDLKAKLEEWNNNPITKKNNIQTNKLKPYSWYLEQIQKNGKEINELIESVMVEGTPMYRYKSEI